MNDKEDIVWWYFLTAHQLFFKGCWGLQRSSGPPWATWTSCKFHMLLKHELVQLLGIFSTVFLFTSPGLHRTERFQGLKRESAFISINACTLMIYLISFFVCLFVVRVHKVKRETLDWLEFLEPRCVYVYHWIQHYWAVLLCIYSAFQYLWECIPIWLISNRSGQIKTNTVCFSFCPLLHFSWF